jgi:hypothetical protein
MTIRALRSGDVHGLVAADRLEVQKKQEVTLTRVMLGIPVSLGSLRSRRMIWASSVWMVLARRSVRRDIFDRAEDTCPHASSVLSMKVDALENLYLIIDQVHIPNRSDEIDQLAQRAFDVPGVIADHRDANDSPAMLVQGADLGDGDIMSPRDPVLKALDHAALVLERHRITHGDFQLQHANRHLRMRANVP